MSALLEPTEFSTPTRAGAQYPRIVWDTWYVYFITVPGVWHNRMHNFTMMFMNDVGIC